VFCHGDILINPWVKTIQAAGFLFPEETTMTWSVKIVDAKGNAPKGDYFACQSCKHGQYPPSGPAPCNIYRMASPVGSVLTSVDTGADGHIACGTAVLHCDGYEPR